MASPVVFQCNACRALGSAAEFVVADDGTRAGLVCGLCRFTSWLPATGQFREQPSSPPPAVTVEQPALPAPTSTTSSTSMTTTTTTSSAAAAAAVPLSLALVPAPTTALASSFSSEQLAKIQARILTLVPPNDAQHALAEKFEQLLASTWATEALHKALLKAAAISGELAFVGARYRAVLDVVRDEPRAKQAQQELLTLAMATMQQSKDIGSVSEGGSNRGALIAAVLIGALLLIGGAFLVKMMMVDRSAATSNSIN